MRFIALHVLSAATTSSGLTWFKWGTLALLFSALTVPVSGQKFFPDDPIAIDPDTISIPKPAPVPSAKLLDLLKKSFVYKPPLQVQRARNINTLGEVPDSSWFTNRIGHRQMDLTQLRHGPSQAPGPDVSQPLIIRSLKLDGVTPGFVVEDSRGEAYFCKVDPLDYPQMTTSAELISSKFFHAFGYNVPQNYLAFIHPDQLVLKPRTEVKGKTGKTTILTADRLRSTLRSVPRRPDGTIQVFASRRLPGELLGPFDFLGTRHDDANDIFPHQDRRELRGLYVFASWLNHNDSDSTNTLDSYVTEGGRSFVRHYLIDFGTTLGSGAVVPHPQRAGYEYFFEWRPIVKGMATFGFVTRPWQHIPYSGYPAVGRFESEVFEADQWKPDYPNPAFLNLQNEDAFWAAAILARFDDLRIRAVVETGLLEDSEAEDYLLQTLIQRRDKILNHWFSQVNPLNGFEIQSRDQTGTSGSEYRLVFENLGTQRGLGEVENYDYQWFVFDNQTSQSAPVGEPSVSNVASLPVPSHAADYLLVRIHSRNPSRPHWNKAVEVYLRRGNPPTVVAIEREN